MRAKNDQATMVMGTAAEFEYTEPQSGASAIARSDSLWLEIRFEDRRHVFELPAHDERAIVVGSTARAEVRIDRPGVAPVHFHLEREGDGVCLVPAYKTHIRVNAAHVVGPYMLGAAAAIELGRLRMTLSVYHYPPARADRDDRAEHDTGAHAVSYVTRLPSEADPTRVAMPAVTSRRRRDADKAKMPGGEADEALRNEPVVVVDDAAITTMFVVRGRASDRGEVDEFDELPTRFDRPAGKRALYPPLPLVSEALETPGARRAESSNAPHQCGRPSQLEPRDLSPDHVGFFRAARAATSFLRALGNLARAQPLLVGVLTVTVGLVVALGLAFAARTFGTRHSHHAPDIRPAVATPGRAGVLGLDPPGFQLTQPRFESWCAICVARTTPMGWMTIDADKQR